MATLVLDRVSKRFGATAIVHDVDLDIADGEFVVLVGPSGCGKSTLLRMIAGLEQITGGELRIGGRRANEMPPQRRNVAMVFQSYALFPHMTARGNIAYGPRLRGEARDSVAAHVARASTMLTLDDYLERRPSELSGGQRQRVAMGRAVVRDPDAFLFDEPLSNLDAKLRVQMRAEIKALHRRLGSTIVYVTHDQIEAMTMADRIVVMQGGRVEQAGAPAELYDRPRNRFVAGFLGSPSMSFLPARAEPGQVRLADGTALPFASAQGGEGAVVLGLRPESFRRIDPGPEALRLLVDLVEPTGAETHLHGTAAGSRLVVAFPGRMTVAPGETVGLAVAPEAGHLFDRETGDRL